MNVFAVLPDGSLALLPAEVAEAMSYYLAPEAEPVDASKSQAALPLVLQRLVAIES